MTLANRKWDPAARGARPADAPYDPRLFSKGFGSGDRDYSDSFVDDLSDYAAAGDALSADISDDQKPDHAASRQRDEADIENTRMTVNDVAKRAIDIVGASTLLLMLLPIFLTIGVIVSKDGGKVFFGHDRVGRGGRKFRCLKFRSMVNNADVVLANLLATDPRARDEWNRDFKLKDDVRITRIGRILRKTSLDELPQLWNVLRGDMSLVGPRPIVEKELPRYGTDAPFYLMVKPGMTGLWQVSGRNDVDYATRVSLDVTYVKERSVLLDVSILLRTFKVVFERDGAY
jgi:Undecaprenyl-phosphate galactose phosphotransferase WbaP